MPTPIDTRKISELNLRYQPYALRILNIADTIAQRHDMRCRLTTGYRSPAEQDEAFGRGTSHVRAGFSWHQYGLALDLGIFDRGEDGVYGSYLSGPHPRAEEAAHVLRDIGKEITVTLGLGEVFWGGRFPERFGAGFVDNYHFEWHPGYSVQGGAAQIHGYLSRPSEVPLYPTVHLPPMPPTSTDPGTPTTSTTGGDITITRADWEKLKALDAKIHDSRVIMLQALDTFKENAVTESSARAQQYDIYRSYDPSY